MARTATTRRRRPAIRTERIELHGHDVHYRIGGEGPPIVLIHGITSTSETWNDVLPWLAERHTVLAPDLMGHGESAKPRGDYSLGAYASGVRDLMIALGIDRATFVGHSLGGGVALQLAYQFPERLDRLVLVSSGGLGREVHMILRLTALPGAEYVLPLLVAEPLRNLGGAVAGLFGRLGLRAGLDMEEIARGFASLGDVDARQAFVHTARSIIDLEGQRVSANDRLYLAAGVPSLLVWGERDPIIPAHHGRAAHFAMPGSRLELFPTSGHFPHRDDPRRWVELLSDFIEETEPADLGTEELRELVLGRGRRRRGTVAASRRRVAAGGR
jgi:pimeloyl-ACP methyl ester carboxylesterase